MDFGFLTVEDVLFVHGDQIERYGGEPGIRDLGSLRSAVSMPQAGVDATYFHGDVFEMAAAYLFHLVQGHPFVDGNKRVGTAAAIVFLDFNGYEVEATDDELVAVVIGVATGRATKSEGAVFLRDHAERC